ncbi:Zn-dependent hydrolase [Marinococcus halotolerans]|uniref:Zn-dependent hydrolase n=1 Tax=Marinococcus halotolerans TaxID=301092 RepID=UPI0003B3F2CD|nr:Zn-dependent hydrolase [Marinococcus halotolerans]
MGNEGFSRERLLQTIEESRGFPSIDPEILASRLEGLAAIGRTEEGGITRYVYTEEEQKAKNLFRSWMQEAGLSVREDGVGNIYGLWESGRTGAPIILTGSHLDTVKNGGAFDGALGCVSSLMAVEALKAEGAELDCSIEIAVFVDEEGARFGSGMLGSRAAVGDISKDDFFQMRDEERVTAAEAMKLMDYSPNKLESNIYPRERLRAYLELHVEQGKQLEQQEASIGVVEGIAGPSWLDVHFFGETDHAGNTPMNIRKDAAAAAAEFILYLENLPTMHSDTAVATVGRLSLEPNGSNVIAGEARLTADIRDLDEKVRDQMISLARSEAEKIAERRGITVSHEVAFRVKPVPVPEWIRNSIEDASRGIGLTTESLVSGASHDAMMFGAYVPFGLLFVPSFEGKSHTPEEFTELKDCVNGVAVLKETIRTIGTEKER